MSDVKPAFTVDRAGLQRTADYIEALQKPDGSIPWFEGGVLDPWDHVESAMGLAIDGRINAARAAFEWLATHQSAAGYWLAAYRGGAIVDGSRAETNFVAYCATGLWHHYLITRDGGFLKRHWPMLERAINFVLTLQSPHGEIYWALDTRKGISRDALVTGNSSIYGSLGCAIAIAVVLGKPVERWRSARARLHDALSHKPERFDRTWASKERYSMDWFYPVLTGVLSRPEASTRIDERWTTFIEPGLGCRCVSDQPWVTIAETCELVLSLCRIGQTQPAAELFGWLAQFQDDDGGWWTGWAMNDAVLWPAEKPTWTAGAVLLAADALYNLTPGRDVFLVDPDSAAAKDPAPSP